MGVKPLPIELGPEDVSYTLDATVHARLSSTQRAAILSFGGGVIGGLLWGFIQEPQLRLEAGLVFFLAWSALSLYLLHRYLPIERARNVCLDEAAGRELNLNGQDMLISALWVYAPGSAHSVGERSEGLWYRLPWRAISSWLTLEHLGSHGHIVEFKNGEVVRLLALPLEIEQEVLRRLELFGEDAKITRRRVK